MAGDAADMMLDGTLCEGCGVYLDDGPAPGFPRYCSAACAPPGCEDDPDDDDDLDFDLEFEVECLRETLEQGRAAEGLSAAATTLFERLAQALEAFDAADQTARESE